MLAVPNFADIAALTGLLLVNVLGSLLVGGDRRVVVAHSHSRDRHQLMADANRGSPDELPGACDPDEEAHDY